MPKATQAELAPEACQADVICSVCPSLGRPVENGIPRLFEAPVAWEELPPSPPSPAASISCPSRCPQAWHSPGVVKAGPGNLGCLGCPQLKFRRSQNHNVLAGPRAQIRGCRGMSGRPTGRPQPASGSWEACVAQPTLLTSQKTWQAGGKARGLLGKLGHLVFRTKPHGHSWLTGSPHPGQRTRTEAPGR